MAKFCIRCGCSLTADHPLCPRCGLNTQNPQHVAPVLAPSQYGMPAPPQYDMPAPSQYGMPAPPQYGASVPLYTRPVTAKERRRARRAAFDDSKLPLYGVEQWPEEGIPEGLLDPQPFDPQIMPFPIASQPEMNHPDAVQIEIFRESFSQDDLPLQE